MVVLSTFRRWRLVGNIWKRVHKGKMTKTLR
jgi:hypothetical protein